MIEFNRFAVGTVIKQLRTKKKRGIKQANFETLWKIANALEVSPHELVFLIEKEAEAMVEKAPGP